MIVAREAPIPTLMLRHLTTLSELGVVVLPETPAYYLRPRTIEEVTDYMVGKILDQFGLPHQLYKPWGSDRRLSLLRSAPLRVRGPTCSRSRS